MHKTRAEAGRAARSWHRGRGSRPGVDLAVCAAVHRAWSEVAAADRSRVAVYAQNMHQAEGAFTGEVSVSMLIDAGANGVLLGHSERRHLFGETDEALAEKVPAALGGGLKVILCVGDG